MTSFVLDASVTMTWLLADAKQGDHAYAATVLEAMKNPETLADVPVVVKHLRAGLEFLDALAKTIGRRKQHAAEHVLLCFRGVRRQPIRLHHIGGCGFAPPRLLQIHHGARAV